MSETSTTLPSAPQCAPSSFNHFYTPRLFLREARCSDVSALHPILSDPESMAYWSSLPHTSLPETEEWVSKMIASPANGITDFIIVDRSTDTPIGKMGIWSGNEIGFLIERKHWRKGLAAEALARLLVWYFGQDKEGGSRNGVNIERITADVDPRNAASRGLLTRFGFVEMGRRERTYQIGEEWVDSVDFELTREAWANMQEK